MRMPEAGPFGETFFEASDRAMAGALLVNRSLGGCVESVVTVFTHRFDEAFFAVDFFFADDRGGMAVLSRRTRAFSVS